MVALPSFVVTRDEKEPLSLFKLLTLVENEPLSLFKLLTLVLNEPLSLFKSVTLVENEPLSLFKFNTLVLNEEDTSTKLETDIPATVTAPNEPVEVTEPDTLTDACIVPVTSNILVGSVFPIPTFVPIM